MKEKMEKVKDTERYSRRWGNEEIRGIVPGPHRVVCTDTVAA